MRSSYDRIAAFLEIPIDESRWPRIVDLADPDPPRALFDAAEAEFGPVEILVSNAGVTKDTLLLRMGEDDFTSVIDANLTAAYRVSKRATQGMLRARAGRIIFMSSVVALLGSAGQANYAAAKAGIASLTIVLARELERFGVRVNCIAPGGVSTPIPGA